MFKSFSDRFIEAVRISKLDEEEVIKECAEARKEGFICLPYIEEVEQWERCDQVEKLRPVVYAIAIIIPAIFGWMIF